MSISSKFYVGQPLVKIGIVRGFTPYGYNNKNYEIKEYSDIESLIDDLHKKNIDAIYLNKDLANYNINKSYKEKIHVIFRKDSHYNKGYYRISTIKHKDIIILFNKFLIHDKKEIDEVKKKYF